MKIAIVDYGMGNIKSLESILKHLGAPEVNYTKNPESLFSSDKVILPGVGSFGEAIDNIEKRGLRAIIEELAIERKKTFLGICLGMQIMANSSEEAPDKKGLGLIQGNLTRFPHSKLTKVPHVGFNQVEFGNDSTLFKGLSSGCDFYFTHSFKLTNNSNIQKGICRYGEEFIAAFEQENLFGTQFHPELSQQNGLALMDNFLRAKQC